MFAILSLVTSCLGDDNSQAYYYDDVALTSFSLGSLNRTYSTKSSKTGKDTTYTYSYSASSYLFSIDQQNGKIYNIDSLPNRSDTKKCLVTIGTMNSGSAYLKSLTSDSLFYISATDSLDFSQKRIVTVVSNDGRYKKDYEVDVRVHKEKEDSLYWTKKTTNSSLAALTEMKAITFKGKLYVAGVAGSSVKIYSTPLTDGVNWTENASAPFSNMPSIACNDDYIYVHSGNKVYNSTDGNNWNEVADGTGIKAIVAASRSEVYAIATDGKILKSADNGCVWSYDNIDDDASYLPQENVSGFCSPTRVNPDIDKMLIIGNRGVATDSTAVVWTKAVDNSNPSETMPWMYQAFTSDTWHHAPVFNHLAVVGYAEGALLLGSVMDGGEAKFYFMYSSDFGLNWWHDKRFVLPSDMHCNAKSFSMAADEDNVTFWIVSGETGEVWQGYYSTWAWQ